MTTLANQLLIIADLFCTATGRSRGRISTIVFGSGDRLDGIAGGKDLLTGSYEKAMLWFSTNWPDDLEWPEGIDRPNPRTEKARERA